MTYPMAVAFLLNITVVIENFCVPAVIVQTDL